MSAGDLSLRGVSVPGFRFGDLLLLFTLVLAHLESFGIVGSEAVLPDFSALFQDRQAAVEWDPSFLQKSHFNFSFGVLHWALELDLLTNLPEIFSIVSVFSQES